MTPQSSVSVPQESRIFKTAHTLKDQVVVYHVGRAAKGPKERFELAKQDDRPEKKVVLKSFTLNFLRIFMISVFLSFGLFFYFFHASLALAAAYNASDVLGQSNDDGITFDEKIRNNARGSDGFFFPNKSALDTVNHRLFVSDTMNRVLVFNLDNNNDLLDRDADFVLGQPNLGVDNSGTTQNQMITPVGLAFDSVNNRLFVADQNNSRILVFDTTTITNGMNASNVIGQANFTSSATGLTQSTLNRPAGLGYDSTGNRLFVADWQNHRVLVFDTNTITDGMNAAFVLGQANFTSAAQATTQSGMRFPHGVAYDSAHDLLFVADKVNNRVLTFDTNALASGMNATNVLGQANFTSAGAATTQSGMGFPVDVVLNTAGTQLFVSDDLNNRILVFNTTLITDGMNAANVLGQANFTSAVGATTQSGLKIANLFGVAGLEYDSTNNNLFIADYFNNRIMIFDTTAISNGMNASDVLGQTNDSGDPVFTTGDLLNNSIYDSGVNTPSGVTIDSVHHRLFIADTFQNRILVFNLDSSNSPIDNVADYVLGQTDFASTSIDDGTTSSTLSGPRGLAYDATNDLLFVADGFNNRVLVYNVATITNGMPSSNVLGQANFTSSGTGTTSSTLSTPQDLTYEGGHHRLFVSDSQNRRVLVFDVTSISDGEPAINVLGQTLFTTSTSTTSQSGMKSPQGTAYDDATDRLFVADGSQGSGNSATNRVLVFDLSAGITNGMAAVNVLGQSNFTSFASGTTASTMFAPKGLAYDSLTQNLFVSEITNSRITIFPAGPGTIANGESATGVIGQADFVTNTFDVSQTALSGPKGIVFDSELRKLFVVDSFNDRIMIFDFVTLSTPASLPAGNIVSAYSQSLTTANDQGTVTTAVVSGALPNGITLSGNSLTGDPTVAGSYTFAIQATDTTSVGAFVSPPVTYSLSIDPAPASSGSGGGSLPVPPVNPINPPSNQLQFAPSYPIGALIQQGATIYLITAPYVAVGFTTWPAFVGLGYQLRYVIQDNLFGYRIPTDYFLSSPTQSHPWTAWVSSWPHGLLHQPRGSDRRTDLGYFLKQWWPG